MVLPVFLVCILTIAGYGNVMGCASRIAGAMTIAGEEMAIAAYTAEGGEGEGSPLLGAAVSLFYAGARTKGLCGDLSSIKGFNLIRSRFLEEDNTIDLIATYKPAGLASMVRIPWIFFTQEAYVRAWTGREGSEGSGESSRDGDGHQHRTVYVAENGVVYHTDSRCTHISLSIVEITRDGALAARNNNGARYHSCEKCGSHASDMVYITPEGDRYHSSLECSGLKRTVSEMDIADASHLRPCSKCAGHG